MNDIDGAYKSPDKKQGFNLLFEGEIGFGPEYYRLQLNCNMINDRIFGFEFKWHPYSKYLALQEWLTTDYGKGPITALTLIDLENNKIVQLSKTDKGFIKPVEFIDELILLEKITLMPAKRLSERLISPMYTDGSP